MPVAPRLLLPCLLLFAAGCAGESRVELMETPEERLLLAQLTRDPYVEVLTQERNDLDQLVVTTRQGSQRVRYVFKPARPGDAELLIHKIADRSELEVGESDQLGTGPQPASHGRYR